MSHPPVVLCATDLRPSGQRAVLEATRIAAGAGASMILLHSEDEPPDMGSEPVPEPMREVLEAYRGRLEERSRAADEALGEAVAEIEAQGVTVSVERLTGRAYSCILESAFRHRVALIVVGGHGGDEEHGGQAGRAFPRLLGTCADRVVRHADRPVWVCTGDRPHAEGPPEVVVGLDLGEASASLLEWIGKLKGELGFAPTLVHTISTLGVAPELFGPDSAAGAAAQRESALRLERLSHTCGLGDVPRVVAHGEPEERLFEIAARAGADAVVVGQSAQPGWAEALLGSSAERCLRQADRPVCVVPAKPPVEG